MLAVGRIDAARCVVRAAQVCAGDAGCIGQPRQKMLIQRRARLVGRSVSIAPPWPTPPPSSRSASSTGSTMTAASLSVTGATREAFGVQIPHHRFTAPTAAVGQTPPAG